MKRKSNYERLLKNPRYFQKPSPMWCWRRLLKVSWIEKISNEEVLRILGSDRELLVKIRARQMRFVGHVMRRGKIEDPSHNE